MENLKRDLRIEQMWFDGETLGEIAQWARLTVVEVRRILVGRGTWIPD